MKRLTDTQVRGCIQGRKISEPVEPTGNLTLWHKASGRREWYFRKQTKGGKDVNEKLGAYPDIPLAKARQLAKEVAVIIQNHPDLKAYRARQQREKERAEEAARLAAERAAGLGSLSDLCRVYIEKMRSEGRASWPKVEAALIRYVLAPFPELADAKAKDITTEDIARILGSMMEKGITTHTNRTRGDLHAAFNVGLCYDYTPSLRCEENLYFEIQNNPVARIKPTKKFERALMRSLTADELHQVWNTAPVVMNPIYAALLRVMICTGFHPAELLRLKCSDVNLEEQSIYMVQTKSGAPNLIPLNCYAIAELRALLVDSNPDDDLFPSRVNAPRSDIYARVSVLANQIARLRAALPDIDHFTARDFRRTVKTLMGKAGISKEMRDRLQNHALQDVSSRHYDRYDYWPEKQAAMTVWENWLTQNVIDPTPVEALGSNVVLFRARQ